MNPVPSGGGDGQIAWIIHKIVTKNAYPFENIKGVNEKSYEK